MVQFTSITTLALCALAQMATARVLIARQMAGTASQDYEPAGQQSICTQQMGLPDTSTTKVVGAYAAAIVGGSSQCGACYILTNSGSPHAPGQGPEGQPTNSITVQIVNECPNCAPGQFDINNAPAGWDNPSITYTSGGC